MARADELSAGEWAVLALLAESPRHGWAAVQALAPHGEIGRVWSLPRPLVYRALETLKERQLLENDHVENGGSGPRRTVMRPTRAGRARVKRWLREPVEHVRDARWLLLLKLLYCNRSSVDPRPLLEAQRATLTSIEAGLTQQLEMADTSEQMLASFRLETARAVHRFVERQLVLNNH